MQYMLKSNETKSLTYPCLVCYSSSAKYTSFKFTLRDCFSSLYLVGVMLFGLLTSTMYSSLYLVGVMVFGLLTSTMYSSL